MKDADTALYVEVQYLDGRKESYGANVVVESDYSLILTRTSPEPHELRIPMRNIAWYGCAQEPQDTTQTANKLAPPERATEYGEMGDTRIKSASALRLILRGTEGPHSARRHVWEDVVQGIRELIEGMPVVVDSVKLLEPAR